MISNSEAAGILIKQLAFENANSTCQAILRPIKISGQLIDYIRQCADVGPSMMQGVAIAAATKGNSYQQAVPSFFTNKNNQRKVIPVTKAEIVCPELVFPVAKRDKFSVPAFKEQPLFTHQMLPPHWLCLLRRLLLPHPCLLISLGLFALVVRKDIIG